MLYFTYRIHENDRQQLLRPVKLGYPVKIPLKSVLNLGCLVKVRFWSKHDTNNVVQHGAGGCGPGGGQRGGGRGEGGAGAGGGGAGPLRGGGPAAPRGGGGRRAAGGAGPHHRAAAPGPAGAFVGDWSPVDDTSGDWCQAG